MANKTLNSNASTEKAMEDVRKTVGKLAAANNTLTEEVTVLKQNYNQLIEDINSRFKVVHDKLFRPGGPRSGAEGL